MISKEKTLPRVAQDVLRPKKVEGTRGEVFLRNYSIQHHICFHCKVVVCSFISSKIEITIRNHSTLAVPSTSN